MSVPEKVIDDMTAAEAFHYMLQRGVEPEWKLGPGRPSCFNEDTAAEICTRISQGETLTAICKEKSKPSVSTFYDWLHRFPNIGKAYAHARKLSADSFAYKAVDAAEAATNKDDASAAKVKSDTFIKVAERLNPDQWADRRNGPSAVQINIQSNLDDPRIDAERRGEYKLVVEDAEVVSDEENYCEDYLRENGIEL